jgi:hypothetical protein
VQRASLSPRAALQPHSHQRLANRNSSENLHSSVATCWCAERTEVQAAHDAADVWTAPATWTGDFTIALKGVKVAPRALDHTLLICCLVAGELCM